MDVRIDKDEKSESSDNLKETKDLITRVTERLLKKENAKITKTPIHVKITKSDLIDLTLIDLPGLTYLNQDGIELSDYI